jgi:hypothetical protein
MIRAGFVFLTAAMVGEVETRAALVVMEAGARWPSYSGEVHGRASNAVVESQPPSESLAEFASRVVARIKRLEAKKTTIPVAIVAMSQRVDGEATSARYRVARAILSAMSARGEGELVIAADEHLPDEARHQLVAFAGALCDGLRGSDVSVRVRFATSPSRSGVRAVSEPPPVLTRDSYG